MFLEKYLDSGVNRSNITIWIIFSYILKKIDACMYYLENSVYEPAYDVIYDWEAIIIEDEFNDLENDEDLDLDEDEEEEEEDLIPELWLPGSTEIGEA